MKYIIRRKSKIHGLGFFANKDFKKGDTVIKWKSLREISATNLDKLSKAARKNVSLVRGKYYLVPLEGRVNHSCNSNTYLKDFRYIAKRNIKKGGEITTDYRKEADSSFEMKCDCGGSNCKGAIKS